MSSINNNSILQVGARRDAALGRLAIARTWLQATTEAGQTSYSSPMQVIAATRLESTLAVLTAEAESMQRTASMAATADSALGQISEQLTQAGILALANTDTTLTPDERLANQVEIDAITSNITRLAASTRFNTIRLLDGTATLSAGHHEMTIDSITPSDLGETIIDGTTYHLSDTGSGQALDTSSSATGAGSAGLVITAAQEQIRTLRGKLGSFQSTSITPRLNIVSSSIEQMTAAQSTIGNILAAAQTSIDSRSELLQWSARFLNRPYRNTLSFLSLVFP